MLPSGPKNWMTTQIVKNIPNWGRADFIIHMSDPINTWPQNRTLHFSPYSIEDATAGIENAINSNVLEIRQARDLGPKSAPNRLSRAHPETTQVDLTRAWKTTDLCINNTLFYPYSPHNPHLVHLYSTAIPSLFHRYSICIFIGDTTAGIKFPS